MNLPIMEKAMPTDKFFQSVEKSRLSDEVARQIERIIAEGRFLPGQKLPSEPLLDQDKHKAAALRHAEQVGISAEFHAWQKVPRFGSYSVESLKKPPKK